MGGSLAALTLAVLVGTAETPAGEAQRAPSLSTRETLTGGWFGVGAPLAEHGIVAALSVTQVFQVNADGGLRQRRGWDQWPGSYDLEIETDLKKAVGLTGGRTYALAEGSWKDGINDEWIGALQSVNADAAGDRAVDLTELWYEQALFDRLLTVRIGKIDLTGGVDCHGCPVSFDGNSYANDETTQFLNAALVNNPTIPFPEKGLGVMAHLEPAAGLYVSAGVADADADKREAGFNTAFGGPDNFFSIYEAGVVLHLRGPNGPLPGAYRIGLWYDPRSKERFAGGSKVDDIGFYASLDQMLWRENAGADDDQGIGVFCRAGWADEAVNAIRTFWSAGAQWKGMIAGRDADVLGVGVAQGQLSTRAEFSAAHETVMETYCNCEVTPWLHVTPSVQLIWNAGGDAAVDTALVFGIRAQMAL